MHDAIFPHPPLGIFLCIFGDFLLAKNTLPAGRFDPLRVTLVASPEALRERCRADGRDEESVVRSLERLPLYRAFPDSLLDTTQTSRDEVAEQVLDRIAGLRLLGS